MDENEKQERQEAKDSLERVQKFEVGTLSRVQDLGRAFEFTPAIEPAKELITLFEQVPVRILDELPLKHVKVIKQQADALYNYFQSILNFDASQNDAANLRQNILTEAETYYNKLFDNLFHYISYAVSRTVDFKSLEKEGRAAVQAIEDKTSSTLEKLNTYEEQARGTLEQVRQAAAEQGVSQQAHHFKTEAEEHEKKAEEWRNATIFLAIVLGLYGLASIFVHKIPFLTPVNLYESVQLVASKVVIFFVLSYVLSLSAKNFLSHKHNALVNKHRQNSLMTFTALVEAAGKEETRDVILNHAASCIFAPQESGYIKGSANAPDISSKTIIETLPRATIPLSH